MSHPGNYYKDFLAEAEDIIHDLNKNLYALKSICNSAGVHDPEVVNALFREIHTLKGISEVTGFPRISSLSHKLEDLLDCLRFGRVRLTNHVVDTLFGVADTFTELLKNINEQGSEYAEIGPAIDRIGDLLTDKVPDGSVHTDYHAHIPNGLPGNLSEFEQHRIAESLKQGRRIYKVIARMHIDNVDVEMAKLRECLAVCGEIIAVIPASGFSADGKVVFEIIYSSGHENPLRQTTCHPEFIPGSQMMQGGETLKQVQNDSEIMSIQEIESGNTSLDTQDQDKNTDVVDSAPQSAKSIAKTVRVDIERLEDLLNDVGEILLLNSSLAHSMNELKMAYGHNATLLDAKRYNSLLHKRIALLRDGLIDIRLVPIGYLFSRLYRIVDLMSRELSKTIRLEVSGGDTKLDKSMIEELADPLMHIIRNAIDHGIEDEVVRKKRGKDTAGTVRVKASQRESSVVIDIEDDGGGIDYDLIYRRALEMGLIEDDGKDQKKLLRMLFMPGFTTKNRADDVSGRGVGLDVVARNIENLSGVIDVETAYGKGSAFRITIPITLLIVRALIISVSGREVAIPVNSVSENLRLKECEIKMIRDRESINLRGDYLPLVRLKDVLKYPGEGVESLQKSKHVIIAGLAQKKMGIVVDKIYGQREILIKHPGKLLKEIQCISGFAEIDSRKVVPVIDISGLIEKVFVPQVPS